MIYMGYYHIFTLIKEIIRDDNLLKHYVNSLEIKKNKIIRDKKRKEKIKEKYSSYNYSNDPDLVKRDQMEKTHNFLNYDDYNEDYYYDTEIEEIESTLGSISLGQK